jgi:hypothetical protein
MKVKLATTDPGTAYGERWINQGYDWKLLHVQETNVK